MFSLMFLPIPSKQKRQVDTPLSQGPGITQLALAIGTPCEHFTCGELGELRIVIQFDFGFSILEPALVRATEWECPAAMAMTGATIWLCTFT